MIHNDLYYFDLKINGQTINVLENDLDFQIHDSVNCFYNNAILNFNDVSGSLREFLLFSEGVEYELSFGFKDNFLRCKYTVDSDDTKEQTKLGTISLPTKLSLVNSFFKKEEIKSEAYNKKISEIVSDIFSSENFKKNIETTSSKAIWYRPLQTQKEFIEMLCKKANPYGENTPYYCFFNCDNSFNFVSYENMLNQQEVTTLYQFPQADSGINLSTVYEIKEFKQGSLKTKPYWNRRVFSRDVSTGEYKETICKMSDYPKKSNYSIPIIFDNRTITGYIDTGNEEDKTYNTAMINYGLKNTFFLERFVVTTIFNPNLMSGKKINLETKYSPNLVDLEKANYISGEYLIEDCIHIWDNKARRATTQIIIGRKFAKIPSDYKIKKDLINV